MAQSFTPDRANRAPDSARHLASRFWHSTANIGVHHVHHLSARIPSYRLGEVLRDHPELRGANRLTLRHRAQCFRLALWDEDAKRLVSFREAQRPPGGFPD